MNRIIKYAIIALLVTSFATAPLAAASAQDVKPGEPAPLTVGSGTIVPNQYIVVLKPATQLEARTAVISEVEASGGKLLYKYDTALNGFSAVLSTEALQSLRLNSQVAFIEANQVVSLEPASESTPDFQSESAAENNEIGIQAIQGSAPWGLDRIDQRTLPLNKFYTYLNNGAGVNVYIIDSGIRSTHAQFAGRATKDFDSVGDGRNGNDCNGNGTYVAGLIGGTTYGVAKGARLHAVRVLNCVGSGTTAGVIAGVNWVAAHRIKPAVANMSQGGIYSVALNSAVAAAIASGVTFTVGVGNSNSNACNFSPGSTPAAISVGSTTSTDTRTSTSNWGPCLDLFAPGSNITSAWYTTNTASKTLSGTASPFAAGAAALYLQVYPAAAPATVTTALINFSTKNIVKLPAGSPPRLLYSIVGKQPAAPNPVTPTGLIIDNTPTFSWAKTDGATQYRYELKRGTTLIYTQVLSFTACVTQSLCNQTTTKILPLGYYTWRVQAYVGGVWRAYSPARNFSLVSLGTSFSSQFTTDAANWTAVNGIWNRTPAGTYQTNGDPNYLATTKHSGYYASLTYEVRLKRSGTCTACINYLIIRGIPSPLESTSKDWYKALRFQYTNTGIFAIWKVSNGTWTTIQTWTPTPAIIKDDWNTLKIVADAGNIKFFINNTLVWSGAVVAESLGQVGIGMFTISTTDTLDVDWANLSAMAITSSSNPAGYEQVNEINGLGNGFMAP